MTPHSTQFQLPPPSPRFAEWCVRKRGYLFLTKTMSKLVQLSMAQIHLLRRMRPRPSVSLYLLRSICLKTHRFPSPRRGQADKNTRHQVCKKAAILRAFNRMDPRLLIFSVNFCGLAFTALLLIPVQPRWRCTRGRIPRCYAHSPVGQLRYLASQDRSNRWPCKHDVSVC